MNSTLASSLPKQYVLPPICPLMEQSVCMSLPSARPIVHMLLYSPVTARAAVAIPIKKAPASAELIYVFMFYLLSVGDLRRSFQKTIIRLGSSVGDPSHAFVTIRHEGAHIQNMITFGTMSLFFFQRRVALTST